MGSVPLILVFSSQISLAKFLEPVPCFCIIHKYKVYYQITRFVHAPPKPTAQSLHKRNITAERKALE